MASQDARNELKTKLLFKLVQQFFGPTEDEAKTYRRVQSAWTIIRKHRSISTNKHYVRRKIDEIKEKFIVCNYPKYADHLERLCNIVCNHPLCLQHYEVDIQWSLLDLLLSLAVNPTGSLRYNQHKINLEIPENEGDTLAQLEELFFKEELKKDFIPLPKIEDDSDLSDWSETEDSVQKEDNAQPEECANKSIANVAGTILLPGLPPLEIPQRQELFKVKTIDPQIKDRLEESVQNKWWISAKDKQISDQAADRKSAGTFALNLSDSIDRHKTELRNFRDPLTTNEFRLLRELIWATYSPEKCSFFILEDGVIKLRANVTLSSVSAPTLAQFVELRILPSINHLFTLRNFLTAVYAFQERELPKTYEHYAANLKKLLDPAINAVLENEQCLAHQQDFVINSLITFYGKLLPVFRQLEALHAIHETVTLDFGKYPSHINSTFLIAALLHCSNNAAKAMDSNLAIALFLTSMEAFCSIIDTWWHEGRLDDWQEEFLVEFDSNHSISLRPYCKDREKAFFVPTHISKTIKENQFVQLILEHTFKAGYTLNLLYEISRITDLRNSCKAIEGNLYHIFIDDVMNHIDKLAYNFKSGPPENDELDTISLKQETSSEVKSPECHLTTKDEFLLNLFDQKRGRIGTSLNRSKDVCDNSCGENSLRNALDIYEQLEKHNQILPLEEIVLESFSRILQERIKHANMFVVNLYREDINVLQHLRNIRKVLLLEASDLMQQFYSRLFTEIENGKSWANAFVLTMQLDDIIGSRYPDMSSLFRIEITSSSHLKTNKATEAVESITINYSISNELMKIITPENMKTYNDIFRFLLKVKWGLTTLESLKFSRKRRLRLPYASVDMASFLMRRLELLRSWMFYGIQCIHTHLMTHVLQSMGAQLDEEIVQCTNIREMQAVHNSYLATVAEHCFLNENLNKIKLGIEQTLNLVFVLRSEWRSCLNFLDDCDPLAIDASFGSSESEPEDYVLTADIDQVELTYIRCHQYLASMLNNEVYLNQKTFLSGLSAAFNTSLPC